MKTTTPTPVDLRAEAAELLAQAAALEAKIAITESVRFVGTHSNGPDEVWADVYFGDGKCLKPGCEWDAERLEGCDCQSRRGTIYTEGGLFFWDDFLKKGAARVWLGDAQTWKDAERLVATLLHGEAIALFLEPADVNAAMARAATATAPRYCPGCGSRVGLDCGDAEPDPQQALDEAGISFGGGQSGFWRIGDPNEEGDFDRVHWPILRGGAPAGLLTRVPLDGSTCVGWQYRYDLSDRGSVAQFSFLDNGLTLDEAQADVREALTRSLR